MLLNFILAVDLYELVWMVLNIGVVNSVHTSWPGGSVAYSGSGAPGIPDLD